MNQNNHFTNILSDVHRRITIVATMVLMPMILLLGSCASKPTDAIKANVKPAIFPDYTDVTIPAGIAPMNFTIDFVSDANPDIYVEVKGAKGGEMVSAGAYTDFDIDEWHALTEQNKGADLTFTVYERREGLWKQYDDFKMHVSPYNLDAYGLTYRLIAPGYEVGGEIGIYQRDIHTFEESAILEEKAVPGQCMNCHTANKTRGDQFLIHVRGQKGGTIVQNGDNQECLNTKTDSTKANMGYSYWHPSGRYIASSINSIHQSFFVGKDRRIEVFDTMSDVLVYDVQTNELILSPLLQTDDWETYPVFNAKGDTLYYCTSKTCSLPAEYDKPKYSLCKIGFNAQDGTYGEKVDTILSAHSLDKSFTYPRPSYDGRWLMYGVTDFGNFPVNHKEADLWIMDLRTGQSRPITEVNSDDVDSFHNWSSDSHWFVFSSRRGDGMYTRAYISSIDDQGRCTKPFLLPQRNPKEYYRHQLNSYNCPDFTQQRVIFDAHKMGDVVRSDERKQVRIR